MNRTFILNALKGGLTETQIAQSLNVSPSAVHQYVASENLKEEVARESRFREIDNTLNSVEASVAQKLLKSINSPFNKVANDPMKLAQVLKIVNGAKRRSLAEGSDNELGRSTLVQLHLPERAMIEVKKNSRNEVIEVEGRVLETLPAGKLLERVKSDKVKDDEKLESKTVADLL